jgi:alkanesulfonate monooxygenase SsuD/methylene tetrahydromethanopterin reductase-like flavin-dependent oxidoreductase (luciferase family)
MNVLTGLIQQSPDELRGRVQIYQRARRAAGLDAEGGSVTAMVHTFLDVSAASAVERARGPLTEYLRAFVSLWAGQHEERRFATLSDAAKEEMLRFAVERFAHQRAMLGPVERGLEVCAELERAGVGEVACLIDFGLDRASILQGLERIVELARALEGRPTRVEAPGALRA